VRCARRDADDDGRGEVDVDVLDDAVGVRLVDAARRHSDRDTHGLRLPGATMLPGGATTGVTHDGDEKSRFSLTPRSATTLHCRPRPRDVSKPPHTVISEAGTPNSQQKHHRVHCPPESQSFRPLGVACSDPNARSAGPQRAKRWELPLGPRTAHERGRFAIRPRGPGVLAWSLSGRPYTCADPRRVFHPVFSWI